MKKDYLLDGYKSELFAPVQQPWTDNNQSSLVDTSHGWKPTKLTAYVIQLENKYGTVVNVPEDSKDFIKLRKLVKKG